LLTGPTFTAR
jgi:ATP dependent DNA ligase domain